MAGRSFPCRAVAAVFMVLPFAGSLSNGAFASDKSVLGEHVPGTPDVSLRYRFAHIDDDGFDRQAEASTLKILLGYRTPSFKQSDVYVQGRSVVHVGNDTFNDTLNGKTEFPVEADPESLALHQAYLRTGLIPDTQVIAGRRVVKLNNQRFIGSLVWRQNDRTFDGITVQNQSVDDLEVTYGFFFNVNRGFTDRSPIGNFNSATNIHVVNLAYDAGKVGKVNGYSVLAELDGVAAAPGLSSATTGISLDGNTSLGNKASLRYHAEYAFQTDYGDNPVDYGAHYIHVHGGPAVGPVSVQGGFELLGSDDGTAALSAPLGLLHAFNGWADRFLTTPADGIKNAYGKASIKLPPTPLGKYGLTAVFHQFWAHNDSRAYGSEWNAVLTGSLGRHYKTALKYAYYDADTFSVDAQKLWLIVKAQY